jgi:hypothetical protein
MPGPAWPLRNFFLVNISKKHAGMSHGIKFNKEWGSIIAKCKGLKEKILGESPYGQKLTVTER